MDAEFARLFLKEESGIPAENLNSIIRLKMSNHDDRTNEAENREPQLQNKRGASFI